VKLDGRRKIPPSVPRAKVEQARDSAMLQALFYWRLHQETGQDRHSRQAIKMAAAAIRLDAQLTGGAR
jgi:hypothetical protein